MVFDRCSRVSPTAQSASVARPHSASTGTPWIIGKKASRWARNLSNPARRDGDNSVPIFSGYSAGDGPIRVGRQNATHVGACTENRGDALFRSGCGEGVHSAETDLGTHLI